MRIEQQGLISNSHSEAVQIEHSATAATDAFQVNGDDAVGFTKLINYYSQ